MLRNRLQALVLLSLGESDAGGFRHSVPCLAVSLPVRVARCRRTLQFPAGVSRRLQHRQPSPLGFRVSAITPQDPQTVGPFVEVWRGRLLRLQIFELREQVPASGSRLRRDGAVYFFAAAFAFAALAALARFRFATSFAFAAAESFRFGLDAAVGAVAGGSAPRRIFSHLAFCAWAILLRAAALNFLRLPVGASGVAAVVSAGPPDNMARSSRIWASIWSFWDSKPSMAAAMSCGVSFSFGM